SMVVPPRLTDLDPALPAGLDDWFARACALAPADRFGSASDLAARFSAELGSSHATRFISAPRDVAPAKGTSRVPLAVGLGALALSAALTTTYAVWVSSPSRERGAMASPVVPPPALIPSQSSSPSPSESPVSAPLPQTSVPAAVAPRPTRASKPLA